MKLREREYCAYCDGPTPHHASWCDGLPLSHPRKPQHRGCILSGCSVDSRGYSDCLERACPHCGAQDLYEARCLVCGRNLNA
jgi:hypothetical protein